MPQYVHVAEVIGRSFPMDMLRYDQACPASERDAALIADSIADPASFKCQPIQVIKRNNTKRPGWTEGRWSSFGFIIREIESRKVI